MLGDKRYGLTVNLLATKVMPSLIPVVVSPALKLDQVNMFLCKFYSLQQTSGTEILKLFPAFNEISCFLNFT